MSEFCDKTQNPYPQVYLSFCGGTATARLTGNARAHTHTHTHTHTHSATSYLLSNLLKTRAQKHYLYNCFPVFHVDVHLMFKNV